MAGTAEGLTERVRQQRLRYLLRGCAMDMKFLLRELDGMDAGAWAIRFCHAVKAVLTAAAIPPERRERVQAADEDLRKLASELGVSACEVLNETAGAAMDVRRRERAQAVRKELRKLASDLGLHAGDLLSGTVLLWLDAIRQTRIKVRRLAPDLGLQAGEVPSEAALLWLDVTRREKERSTPV